jgi:hypothetical protein
MEMIIVILDGFGLLDSVLGDVAFWIADGIVGCDVF